MPTPRPIIVLRLRTKMDIGSTVAAIATSPSVTVMVTKPTTIGIIAATRVLKASRRNTSVSGMRRCSMSRESSAAIVRTS